MYLHLLLVVNPNSTLSLLITMNYSNTPFSQIMTHKNPFILLLVIPYQEMNYLNLSNSLMVKITISFIPQMTPPILLPYSLMSENNMEKN